MVCEIYRLQLHDPRIVQSYLNSYKQFVSKHESHRRTLAVVNKYNDIGTVTEEISTTLEELDSLGVKGMLLAERCCRKIKAGACDWTPQFQKAITSIHMWTVKVKLLEGKRASTRHLLRLARKCEYPLDQLRTTLLSEAKTNLKEAYVAYRAVCRSTITSRRTWLEELATAQAAEGNTTAEQLFLNLKRREQQRRSARRIKNVLGRLERQGILAVVVPDRQGGWIEVTTKADMERGCLEENKARFLQASGTPFLQPPLLPLVGRLGNTPSADAILSGQFQHPPALEDFTHAFIRELVAPPIPQPDLPMPSTISVDDHIWGWQRAKERTSSGRSGLHFGHFKAGCLVQELAEIDAAFAGLVYDSGYSYNRWKQGINVMLVKKPGEFRVDRLRTILLYEADFNMNNKKMGRDLMA